MSEWTWKIIDDLGQIVTGKTPSTKCPEYWDGDIPFITPKDIQGTKHCEKTERYITNAGSLSAGKVMLGRDAVCVSCIGNIGYVAMTTQNSVTNQQINSIVVNDDHSNDYVYYLMKNLWGYFKTCESQGTSVPILSKSLFSQIPVFVPTIALQRKISAVLSVLDNKIELNHRLNDNLEAMAQALYDYWFVQFDFPDENGRPYKSSGGKMVWNEVLKREIPEGWNAGILNDIAPFKRGKIITKADTSEEKYPVMAGGRDYAYYHSQANAYPPIVTVSASGASAGFTKLHMESIWASDCSYCDSTTSSNVRFAYHFLLQHQAVLFSRQKGSGQPHVSPSDINPLKLPIPPQNVLIEFDNIVAPLYVRTGRISKEMKILTKQRDFLLPLLMNSQVQVKPQGVNYRLTAD